MSTEASPDRPELPPVALPPPLPPPPMGRLATEDAARVPLPWTALPLALAGAVIVALPTGIICASVYHDAEMAVPFPTAMAWWIAACALGAAGMDRLARSWPRVVRWGLGMAIGAFIPNPGVLWAMHQIGPDELRILPVVGICGVTPRRP